MYNPDDIVKSFKSGPSTFDDDLEEIAKESTSLLNDTSSSTNIYQAKQNMQKKARDYKKDNLSSERAKNMFERYIFDIYKYQSFFDTTTDDIHNKLLDALWPFFPANQHHLIANDAEQVREF